KWFDFELTDNEMSIPYCHFVDDRFDEGLRLEIACLYHDAAEAYRWALHVDPDDPILHCNLANVYAALDDPNNSINYFVIAVRIDPEYEEAWTNLKMVRELKRHNAEMPYLGSNQRSSQS